MRNPIYDNCGSERSVKTWLDDHLQGKAHLRVASAYFTIGAFALLRQKLEAISEMRFLFGDPKFLANLDPQRQRAAFELVLGDNGPELRLSQQIRQNSTALACAAWMREKVSIRSVRDGRLSHGKLYHVQYPRTPDSLFGGVFKPHDAALVGSSNFTVYGLGAGKGGGNVELNLEAYDDRDREALSSWFDTLWLNDDFTVDVKDEVLGYLERLSRDNSPEFVYYKTLFHLFEARLQERGAADELPGSARWRDSQIYNALYSFQKHGARGAVHKLEQYGGCILADSVGLGKTYEALAVINYFEKVKRERVLVLCPKKLSENWSLYQSSAGSKLNPFPKDGFGYTLRHHTDLGLPKHAQTDWGGYGLVVIDESHNFRNNSKGKDGRKSRYETLLEDVMRAGVKTKVLLLSATPVNTDLKDLRNQIYLMSEGQDSAYSQNMGIASVGGSLGAAQREFNKWAQDKTHDAGALLNRLPANFFTLLDELSIARSRAHIRKFYANDIAAIGAFPERLPPLTYSPDIDTAGLFPTYDELHADISKYQLALFKPSTYLKEEYKAQYENEKIDNFSQQAREGFLIGMMRVNFLKRLESSVQSFEISMQRTMDKIAELESRIEKWRQFQSENPHITSEGLFAEELTDEERESFEITQVGYNLGHLRLDDWLKDLKKDRKQLNRLYLAAKDVSAQRDAKLACLKKLIAERAQNPIPDKTGALNRKIVIFTAFADTAKYLYDNLSAWAKENWDIESALVTGSGGNASTFGSADFNEILTHFSPVSKKRALLPTLSQNGAIDLLLATDCISEGQNLQDCGMVVNYDIHWNPVRLIQRFGRVDRLGSLHTAIQMVNFWPTDDLNLYINLKNRVEARMALVDVAATNQDNILRAGNVAPEKGAQELIEQDLGFRDEQLLRLRDKTPDLEDLEGGVSLSDFTLDDFIGDLLAFLETRRAEIEGAPEGLFAVAPTTVKAPDAAPGIVFCLRRHNAKKMAGKAGQSRFSPYFLVYIRDDGEIGYSFTDDKRLLSLLRGVCLGHAQPLDKLCRAFDQKTSEGAEMNAAYELLEKVTEHIAQFSRTGAAKSLAQGGLLSAKTSRPAADENWDLVTWIVIANTQNEPQMTQIASQMSTDAH